MLKKISFLLWGLALAGCASTVATEGGFNEANTEISEVNFGGKDNFRVGVLLPLSGSAAKQGQGLKNATMLALEDARNPKLILQYYDTKGTPSGARVAAENALNQQSQLLLGPLMSSSVEAISEQAGDRNVPIIAYNTNSRVLKDGVYTLGLLIEEQVDRIMTFAAEHGRANFALLIPDNQTGVAVAKAAVKSAQKNNVKITRIAFYRPNTTDFSDVLKQMTDYPTRVQRLNSFRAKLSAQAAGGDANAAKVLARLKTQETLGEVDFDAVLIPESGASLKAAVAMFGYYDVFSPKVKFLGTSIWDGTNLSKETTMRGSWYPALSRNHSSYFAGKYADLFGERPSSLYALGYDSVALASALAKQDNADLKTALTDPDGYIGINGAFRLFDDGRNQHSLDIVEVRENGNVIVDEAPRKFTQQEGFADNGQIITDSSYQAPRIFGKSASTAQTLIYGHPLGLENQPLDYIPSAQEREIIKEGLQKLNIVVPD